MLKLQGTLWCKQSGLRMPYWVYLQCMKRHTMYLSTCVSLGTNPCQSKLLSPLPPSLCFYTHAKINARLPFEPDINVKKDTLIYSHNRSRLFRNITAFGLIHFLCWGNIALFNLGTDVPKITSDYAGTEYPYWWTSVAQLQVEYSGTVALLCASIGKKCICVSFIHSHQFQILRQSHVVVNKYRGDILYFRDASLNVIIL